MNQWPLEEYQNDPEFFMFLTMGQFRAELARLMEEMPEITQKKLAELLNVSEARVSNILHSSPNLTMKTMCEVAGAFGKMLEVKLVERVELSEARVCVSQPAVYFAADEYDELVSPSGFWQQFSKVHQTINLMPTFESAECAKMEQVEGVNGKRQKLAA